MTCPNCQTPYTGEETLCKNCGMPLGNADYTPVSSHYRHQRKKRRKWSFVLLILLFVLIVGGIIGYNYYISLVKKNCEQATQEIFSMAHEMDFSSVDPSYLPDELKENPDIPSFIQNQLEQLLDEQIWDEILEAGDIEIDADSLCNEIIRSATYEITDITADYHSCTVTVHTENIDFTQLPETLTERFFENQNENSSLWNNLKKLFSSMFSSTDEEEEDLAELLYKWYEEARETTPKAETTGTIVYGISDGHWTLLSLDEDLLYSYYGIHPDTLK